MKDPIVEEVRKHRMEHTKKFGGDLKAICEDLQRIQAASGHKVVRLKTSQPSGKRSAASRRNAKTIR